LIVLRPEFLRQFVQPALLAVRFDVLERLAVDARRPAIDQAAAMGDPQHIGSIDLVVQRIETKARRLLRFGM
jgi:hypothetical protein